MEKALALFLFLLALSFLLPTLYSDTSPLGYARLYSLDALIVDNESQFSQCGVVIALLNYTEADQYPPIISTHCSCVGKGVVVDKESYYRREDFPIASYKAYTLAFRKTHPVYGEPLVISSNNSWLDENEDGEIRDEPKGPFSLIAKCGEDICIGDRYFFTNDMLSQRDNFAFLKHLAFEYAKEKPICIYTNAPFSFLFLPKALLFLFFLPPLAFILLIFFSKRKEESSKPFYVSLAERIKKSSGYLKEKWRAQLRKALEGKHED